MNNLNKSLHDVLEWLEKVSSPFEWRMHFKSGKLDLLDPAAWTPELYEKIESNPIAINFIAALEDEVMLDMPFPRESVSMSWLFLKATPAQKAQALSRALQEVKG